MVHRELIRMLRLARGDKRRKLGELLRTVKRRKVDICTHFLFSCLLHGAKWHQVLLQQVTVVRCLLPRVSARHRRLVVIIDDGSFV